MSHTHRKPFVLMKRSWVEHRGRGRFLRAAILTPKRLSTVLSTPITNGRWARTSARVHTARFPARPNRAVDAAMVALGLLGLLQTHGTQRGTLTVRLPGAKITPATSTWTCGHTRLAQPVRAR